MLRQRFTEALKTAMKAQDARSVSTVRMIMAGLKDRDIAARSKGVMDGIAEAEIQSMLQGMIKQRRESIVLYQQGNRPELAEQEGAEIAIIEGFLPRQLDEAGVEAAARAAIAQAGATSAKDMGKVMALLKESHAGLMDFSKASAVVKKLLG